LLSEEWLKSVAREVAPLDQAWRSTFFLGKRPDGRFDHRVPPGVRVDTPAAWAVVRGPYAAGLAWSFSARIGQIRTTDAVCDVVGTHGELLLKGPCSIPATAATVSLSLFPIDDGEGGGTSWLCTLEVPIVANLPPPPPPPPPKTLPPWLPLLGVLAGVPIAFAGGRWSNRRPHPATPPLRVVSDRKAAEPLAPVDREAKVELAEEPPPLPASPLAEVIVETAPAEAAAPAPPSNRGDPVLEAQARLLEQHPHLRLFGGWLARNETIVGYDQLLEEVLGESSELGTSALANGLPERYIAAWRALEKDARVRRDQVALVRTSLTQALADPSTMRFAASDVALAWRALMPHSDARVVDKGAALAAQLRQDLLKTSISPGLALAQFLYEALPVEIPRLRESVDPDRLAQFVLQTVSLSEALGYRYDHIPLYGATDADFAGDGDVGLGGIAPQELLYGMPRPEAATPGVVARAPKPLFRPLNELARPFRAHILVFREG
jgi:hypothetical protein